MEKKKKEDKVYKVVLIVFGILLFFLYSFLPLTVGPVFNSPDANANYTFTKIFADKSDLRIFEPLNRHAENIVHPRSTNIAGAYIVPGSFLGMTLLYGALAKILSVAAIPFLTPFFASLGVLFFYGLIKRIFNSKIAFISSLLLFVHPAFWYYASRVMMHNILFLVFLVMGFYFLARIGEKNKWLWYLLGGIFFGAALAVRSAEAIWVFLLLAALALVYRREIKWKFVPFFALGGILAVAPIFYFQYFIYGHPLNTGYTRLDTLFVKQGIETSWYSGILNIIFPFGLDLKNIAKNFINYFLNIFWWFAAAYILGGLFFISKFFKWKKRQYVYFGLLCFLSLWLFVYYGSWDFHDHPDPAQISIGTSYVRYWLPVYAFSLPLAALFIAGFSNWMKNKTLKFVIVVILLALLTYPSAAIVFWQTDESVLSMQKNLQSYGETKEKIISSTEENSVIIASYFDKILFPERRVVYNIVEDYIQKNLPALVSREPVYLYSLFPPEDINYLNEKKLLQYNLEILPYKDLGDGQQLMRVIFSEHNSQNSEE